MAVSEWDRNQIINVVLLFCLMFGLGTSINFEAFKAHFRNPKAILTQLATQYALLPPLAFSIAKMFGLGPIYAISLVVLACCPGGAVSNVLCFLIHADLDLSVAMSTSSGVIATFMLPVNIIVYVKATHLGGDGGKGSVDIDYEDVIASALFVVVGTLSGVYTKRNVAKNGMCVQENLGGYQVLLWSRWPLSQVLNQMNPYGGAL